MNPKLYYRCKKFSLYRNGAVLRVDHKIKPEVTSKELPFEGHVEYGYKDRSGKQFNVMFLGGVAYAISLK